MKWGGMPKRGRGLLKREDGKFLKETIIKTFDLYKVVTALILCHLRTTFHVNIGIMNSDPYVFSASNHQYEKYVSYTVGMILLLQ